MELERDDDGARAVERHRRRALFDVISAHGIGL